MIEAVEGKYSSKIIFINTKDRAFAVHIMDELTDAAVQEFHKRRMKRTASTSQRRFLFWLMEKKCSSFNLFGLEHMRPHSCSSS